MADATTSEEDNWIEEKIVESILDLVMNNSTLKNNFDEKIDVLVISNEKLIVPITNNILA